MIHQMTLRNFKRHIVRTMSISFEMQHFIIQDNSFELSLANCAITRNYSFLYDLSIFVNSPTLELKQILKDQLAHQQERATEMSTMNH